MQPASLRDTPLLPQGVPFLAKAVSASASVMAISRLTYFPGALYGAFAGGLDLGLKKCLKQNGYSPDSSDGRIAQSAFCGALSWSLSAAAMRKIFRLHPAALLGAAVAGEAGALYAKFLLSKPKPPLTPEEKMQRRLNHLTKEQREFILALLEKVDA